MDEPTPDQDRDYVFTSQEAIIAGLWPVAMILAEVIGVLELAHWAGWV